MNGPIAQSFPVVTTWSEYTTHRDPALGLYAGYELPNAKEPEDTVWGSRTIDPRAGVSLPDGHLKIGSQHPLHELHEKHEAAETGLPHDRANVPGPLASVDTMVTDAQRRRTGPSRTWHGMAWHGMADDLGFLVVRHVGDADACVSIYRAGTDRIALVGNGK